MKRRALLAGAALGLIGAPAPATGTPVFEMGWRVGVALPAARSEFDAAIVDGLIVVAGGFDAGVQVHGFDVASSEWRRLANLPRAIHHAGVAALDGKVYVAGGYDAADQRAVDSLFVYDSTRDAWSSRRKLTEARGAFGFVAAGGRLYALGGAAERLSGPAVGAVDCYDPVRDAWERIAALPTPREHLAAAARRGAIYTFGGRANGDESVTFAAAVERLDLATGAWKTEASLPTPRAGLAVALAGDRLVAAGGERGEVVFGTVEAFDARTESWASWPSLVYARHGLGMVDDGLGSLFALGGSVVAGRVRSVDLVEEMSRVGGAT